MRAKRTRVSRFKPVFTGTLFTIEQAQAILPSGARVIFEQAKRKPSVTILPVDSKGNLLLLREYHEHAKRYLTTLPAGKIERGELPRQAAQRELREETGYAAQKLTRLLTAKGTRTLIWPAHVFVAEQLSHKPLPSGDGEDIKVMRVPLLKAAQLALRGKIEPATNCYFVLRFVISRLDLLSQKRTKR